MLKLYENIRRRRIELELTQDQLAERLGYSGKSMIAKIEAGKVDLSQSKIVAFAKALQTTPSHLMGWDDNSVYYSDPETAKKAQEMFEDPDMRSLFDMKKNMDPDKFKLQMDYLRGLYKLEHPEDSDEGC